MDVTSKVCKLIHHQKSQQKQFAAEDIALSPKDFPFLEINDVVEIFNTDEESARVILKISKGSLRLEDFTQKDCISIEQSIASTFQLKPFSDVIINKINPKNVELESVEVTFKDQYLGRSEMWRLKNSLIGTCVYLNKKIEFCSATIRCQVYEMWSHGDKVASGVVTSSTKVVFRSSTSMVYLFIQMSSEMWEFDIYGDLYFEKAVNGFLSELFAKWKKCGSNHEVTIVLFSRIFYSANNLEQFPARMRECLQTDYKGCYYEDYYRVAVQNEKFEDWANTLILLRHLFVNYKAELMNFHKKEEYNQKIPKSYISSAAQGNFLEVLNMSLNVFEKHYMDRSFDRTGQLSVVITPGVGVFEVDRELTNVTMQRIIDNGVGSDLVCVGEQPLHAVPLLKFHIKTASQSNVEDYSMPHWINLSFYSTNKKVGYSTYTPRIKLPANTLDQNNYSKSDSIRETKHRIPKLKFHGDENAWPNSVYDFDDYDADLFSAPNNHVSSLPRRNCQKKKIVNTSDSDLSRGIRRQNSEPEILHGENGASNGDISIQPSSWKSSMEKPFNFPPLSSTPSASITIPNCKVQHSNQLYSSSFGALNIEVKSKRVKNSRDKWFYDDFYTHIAQTPVLGGNSQGCSPKDKKTIYSKSQKEKIRPSRALINPFDPSHAVIKLTSNRRRWTHIFPRGPSGVLIQQHHFHSNFTKLEIVHEAYDTAKPNVPSPTTSESKTRSVRATTSRQSSDTNLRNHKLTLLWGATGEQEWTPALTTGVDWKSLTFPACLPITTDYFPDERSLQVDYVVSDYYLLPDEVNEDYAQQRAIYRTPLTTKEVFFELVSQRLAQGFQLIIRPGELIRQSSTIKTSVNQSLVRNNSHALIEIKEEYFLSIGRIFHRIALTGSKITVTRYRPRHPYPSINIHYRYRFLVPNNQNYEVSWAQFTTEKLENYNWNYMDHYICTRGDRDFALNETLKFWRFRLYLLPTYQGPAKKILEGSEYCNLYLPMTSDEKTNLVDGFLKFIETCINRIRRGNNSASKPVSTRSGNLSGQNVVNTGFRERVGSNRLGERPRPRSGSKGLERLSSAKNDGGSGRVSPAETLDLKIAQGNFSANSESSDLSNAGTGQDELHEFKLKLSASHREIISAMCSNTSGFSFIKSPDLPTWTFVSSDATSWLINHMEGILGEPLAVAKFNNMLEGRLICHASGDWKHPFLNGFYLYCISEPESADKDAELGKQGDLGLFRNEWMEVEVRSDRTKKESESPLSPRSPTAPINFTFSPSKSLSKEKRRKRIPAFKDVYVEVDVNEKSDRQEWGHVRYQSVYQADQAFEMSVQWVQATGSIMTEQVQAWARKAQQCNLQLVPIPNDPFALPYSTQSDSLRGPIFIPLHIDSLMGTKRTSVFEEFPEASWESRMNFLQESILLQFGFIECSRDLEYGQRSQETVRIHYVHSSGNMFVRIPTPASFKGVECSAQLRNFSGSPSNSEECITRHVSGECQNGFFEEKRIGFLWSWNYMVSKRWKTLSTPALHDEAFMHRLLRDFTSFCSNDGDRLKNFWAAFSPEDATILESNYEDSSK